MTTDPVRIGFLGTGFIATYHSKSLKRGGANIVRAGAYDTDADRAQAFCLASGHTMCASEDEVIESADAVYVCTWSSEHKRLVSKVIAAGKAVFCEKPLAPTLAEAEQLVSEVNASGVINQVGLVLRHAPSYLMARELIAEKKSGRVMNVVFRDDQFIPIQSYYASDWRKDASKAGAGTLLEHSIHDVDMLQFLVGDVTDVSARATYAHGIEGIEDVVASSVRFANGAVGTLTTIWHDNLSRPSLRHVEVFCRNRTVVIAGDDWFGPVTWSDADGTTGSLGGEDLVERTAPLAVGDANPDGAFVRAATDGEPGYPDFAVALAAHRVVEAMYESCRSGGSAVKVLSDD